MKQLSNIKVTVITAILLMASLGLQARTVTFKVSSDLKHSDLATALRGKFSQLTYADTAIINFDKAGTYTLDGVVTLKCNAIITGAGADKTTLLLNKDDRKPLKGSDAYVTIAGTMQKPITVSMSDLSIRLKEHNGIWWEGSEFHAFKIYHAGKVDIHHVNSYMSDAMITNFDLRVCSNVTVDHCVISNYNNCLTGGNLWLRGEMHNIYIHHNKFYKYGHDEALAFFSRTINANRGIDGNITRTNIRVTDNEFVYQHKDKTTPGMVNQILFSVLTSDRDMTHGCDMRGFELARNKFVANDLCLRFVHFQFGDTDKHRDFTIHDNEFISNQVYPDSACYHMDFDVRDASVQPDTIVVRNNTLTNNHTLMNPYNGSGYTFVLVRGGNVLLDGNRITNNVSVAPDGKYYGINLLWSGKEGGSATLRNNVCKGLARIITLESGGGIGHFSLKATNNYFKGRTTLYCRKIDELDLDFRNNTFDCNHDYFFLYDFASKGQLVFNNNKVIVSTGNGKLMAHYGKDNSTSSMRFEKLEVKGNEFHGVKSQSDMMTFMTNVRKRSVKSNTFHAK